MGKGASDIDTHVNHAVKRVLVIALLAASYLLVYTQRTGPGVISDQLQAQFHVSAAVLGTIASVQYLLYMLLQIPVGMSADRWGPERLLATGVLLDGAGTVWFSHAASFPALLVGRAIVGLGDALVFVNMVLILGKWCRPEQFGGTLGLVNTCGGLGAVLATVPLALWIGAAGWRVPFRVVGMLLVGIALADALWFRLSGGPPAKQGRAPAPGRCAPRPSVGRVLADIVRDRHAWAAFACHFGLMGTYIGFMSMWAVPFLMASYGLTRSAATWFTLVSFVGAMAGGPVLGWASDRLHSRKWPYRALPRLAAAGGRAGGCGWRG
ncbi:MAG: MFS transporter, partial [Alicyclobacillus sp.]|nr:MFS transporter [Alicyclobacillus sp.]